MGQDRIDKARMWQTKFKGVFDYSGLLGMITGWMGEKMFETHQKKDKHKMKPTGAETEFKIHGWKNLTEFMRFTITIDVWGWDVVDVEVVINGQKKIMQKGRLWIRVNGNLIMDQTDRFGKNNFTVFLRKFLLNKVLHHRIDIVESDMLHYKMLELVTEIKRYLGMTSKLNEYHDVWGN